MQTVDNFSVPKTLSATYSARPSATISVVTVFQNQFLFDYLEAFSINVLDKSAIEDFLKRYVSNANFLYDLAEALEPFKGSSTFALSVEALPDEDVQNSYLTLTITTRTDVRHAAKILDVIERDMISNNVNSMQILSFVLRFNHGV